MEESVTKVKEGLIYVIHNDKYDKWRSGINNLLIRIRRPPRHER